jgi:ABC-type multidrug transport system fused ATPase/permease subunit
MWWYFAVYCAQNLFMAMLKSVLGGRMSFFDTTPVGRMLARFSRDHDTIETSLPQNTNMFLVLTVRRSFSAL